MNYGGENPDCHRPGAVEESVDYNQRPMTQSTERDKPVVGLILSGGGARAAYQVGVLKAIATMLPEGTPNPFPVICGSSAGAINAAALAIYATRFHEGVHRLVHVWRNFRVDQVFRADARGILLNGLRWGAALFLGGFGPAQSTRLARSLRRCAGCFRRGCRANASVTPSAPARCARSALPARVTVPVSR